MSDNAVMIRSYTLLRLLKFAMWPDGYGMGFILVGRSAMFLVDGARSNQTAAFNWAIRYQINWVMAAITRGPRALLTRASSELLLPTKNIRLRHRVPDRGSNKVAKMDSISRP